MKLQTKTHKSIVFLFGLGLVLLSSCATIVGGSRYYANVTVENHPKAKIYYNGEVQGMGQAIFKVPRKDANTFTLRIKEESCLEQQVNFTGRKFRGWAFVGTVVGWTGLYNGIPLPWGVVVDGATAAWWKPDETEEGVYKVDYKNYNYLIKYTGCDGKLTSTIPTNNN